MYTVRKITVKTVFELILAICPMLSVGRPIGKFVVVVGYERGHKQCKNGRTIPLHKFNGVYQVHELTELCALEDPSNVDEPPAEAVRDTKISFQIHSGRENVTFSQSVGIQNLVCSLRERTGMWLVTLY